MSDTLLKDELFQAELLLLRLRSQEELIRDRAVVMMPAVESIVGALALFMTSPLDQFLSELEPLERCQVYACLCDLGEVADEIGPRFDPARFAGERGIVVLALSVLLTLGPVIRRLPSHQFDPAVAAALRAGLNDLDSLSLPVPLR